MVRAAVVLVAVGAFMVLGPALLRQVAFFRVRQVELVGVRYLAPETVLEALALERDRHLFDDADDLERRAAAIPGVVAARVTRRLPATLRVEIVERVPVAFVPTPEGLVALDADGARLPYDPATGALDLPVVPRPDSILIRTLALVRAADSALYQAVDAARRGRGQTVVLELETQEVLLNAMPRTSDIRALDAVRRHLVETGRPFTQLDARFAGWIVVRRGRA